MKPEFLSCIAVMDWNACVWMLRCGTSTSVFLFFFLTIATFSFSLFAQKAKLVVLLQHLENESVLYL